MASSLLHLAEGEVGEAGCWSIVRCFKRYLNSSGATAKKGSADRNLDPG